MRHEYDFCLDLDGEAHDFNPLSIQSESIVEKNCGIGPNGFEAGNTCAHGGEGGGTSSSDAEGHTASILPTSKKKSAISKAANSSMRWSNFLKKVRTPMKSRVD